MNFGKLFGVIATLFSAAYCDHHFDEYVLPSSCAGLDNGEHQLKLMDGDVEDFPVVTLQCSNGYTILDVSKDSGLESYFNTFMKFHRAAAGPSNDVQPNWEGWYLGDDGRSEYVISPDCKTCNVDHARQLYTTDDLHKTAYMMTGTMFGCFWNLKGEHNFDEDYDSYQCYYTTGEINAVGESIRSELNDYSTEDEWDMSGVCAFSVRSSDRSVRDVVKHDLCTSDYISLNSGYGTDYGDSDVYHLKPSIGTDGKFCVCTKPSRTNYYTVSSKDMEAYKSARRKSLNTNANANANPDFEITDNSHSTETQTKTHNTKNNNKNTNNNKNVNIASNIINNNNDKNDKNKNAASSKISVTELYQSDFESGTYRIKTSGIYKIMEDIIFDFNADYDSPNSGDAWWPHSDQSHEYPGAGDYHDSYFLGFWAGITIEADDVILDLNGHSLAMSNVFYHQQRWFSGIALQGQYFLPGQGIGFFGADPHFAQNIIIKDGTIGLSSHHGIHGHFNKNVLISNVHVKDFETHGIQFNGFDGVKISNCEIGPTSEKAYFKGEYGHARTLLPRFQKVADENPTKLIHFYGREKPSSMQEIVDELQKQTDMAYNYVVNGEEYDDEDESWQSAKYLFIDNTNLPNGAAMYGIFLNTYGASVLTYNLYTSFYSSDATVENTVIHGLKHSMNEYVRMSVAESGNLFMNPLHAPFDATQILDNLVDFSPGQMTYKGSVLTDACLAMEKFSNNWGYLQAQLIMDSKMLTWAQKDGNIHALDGVQVGCNIDVMIHSGKGINGLRIDGVDGVVINKIEMYDISEETPLGRSECGEYSEFDGRGECKGACGGHFRQTQPMQIGFSGTMVQGININAAKNVLIKDANIHNLESQNGPVFGISIWPAVDIEFEGNININHLQAGTNIGINQFTYNSRPNIAPEGCGIRLYSEYTSNGYTYTTNVNTDNADSITSSCIESHVSCFDSGVYTHIGDWLKNDQCKYNTVSLIQQGIVYDHSNDVHGKQISSPNEAAAVAAPPKDISSQQENNNNVVITDPSMVADGETSSMFVNLLLFAGIIGVIFVLILVGRRNHDLYKLIGNHDDGDKYTVL